jgi:hypothetical protein
MVPDAEYYHGVHPAIVEMFEARRSPFGTTEAIKPSSVASPTQLADFALASLNPKDSSQEAMGAPLILDDIYRASTFHAHERIAGVLPTGQFNPDTYLSSDPTVEGAPTVRTVIMRGGLWNALLLSEPTLHKVYDPQDPVPSGGVYVDSPIWSNDGVTADGYVSAPITHQGHWVVPYQTSAGEIFYEVDLANLTSNTSFNLGAQQDPTRSQTHYAPWGLAVGLYCTNISQMVWIRIPPTTSGSSFANVSNLGPFYSKPEGGVLVTTVPTTGAVYYSGFCLKFIGSNVGKMDRAASVILGIPNAAATPGRIYFSAIAQGHMVNKHFSALLSDMPDTTPQIDGTSEANQAIVVGSDFFFTNASPGDECYYGTMAGARLEPGEQVVAADTIQFCSARSSYAGVLSGADVALGMGVNMLPQNRTIQYMPRATLANLFSSTWAPITESRICAIHAPYDSTRPQVWDLNYVAFGGQINPTAQNLNPVDSLPSDDLNDLYHFLAGLPAVHTNAEHQSFFRRVRNMIGTLLTDPATYVGIGRAAATFLPMLL